MEMKPSHLPDFSGDVRARISRDVDGRAKALHEVPDLVVVVARPAEPVFHPEAQRYLGVGVMGAQHQDHGMDSDKRVGQIGQGKPPVGQEQDRQGEHEREGFQEPGEAGVVRLDCRPNKDGRYDDQQYQGILI